MLYSQKFDEAVMRSIGKASGSKSVNETIAWLRRGYYVNPDKFACEIFADYAFWAGSICKKHFRLYEIAVSKEYQRRGIGKMMIDRIKMLCRSHNLEKITFRTAKDEPAIEFYKAIGGVIVGDKGNDWEVEIKV